MVINLGNIVDVGGKSVGSGVVSGLDTATLIEGLTTAKRIPAKELEDKIVVNTDKIAAYGELNTILEALKTSVDFLRNPPGFNKESSNIFEFRTSSLVSNTTIAASTYLSSAVSPGATTGSFALEIGNLAKAKSVRSAAFTSKTASVTEAASGTTAGKFSAGTIKYTTTVNTANGDKLAATDYSVNGTALTSVLTSTGISNFTVTNNTGDTKLEGAVSGLTVTVNGVNVDMSVSINGTTYTATGVPANTGVSSDSIAAGAITFTDATSGSTFDITLNAPYVIAANQTNANNLAASINADLAPQTILQSREIGNFDTTKLGATLSGLTRADAMLTSGAFNTTDGTQGSFEEFTVTAVSAAAASDATITVKINGETYTATGLGSAVNDTHTANITLTGTSGRKLALNINTAGLTLDFSTATTAQAIEDALDSAFGVNVTSIVINQSDSLVDIAASINAQTSKSDVSASVIKVSDSEYRLNIQSDKDGIANQYSLVDTTGVMTEVTFTTQQAAEDSQVSVDGITLTRSTNSINDVVDGITFNLVQVTPNFGVGGATKITTTVSPDVDTAEAGIVNFINAYNDFRVFAEKHTKRDDNGNLSEDALLGSENTLRNLISQTSAEVNRIVGGVSNTNFSALANIGITITDFAGDAETAETSNILTYDPTKLKSSLTANYSQLREIFEFTFFADSSDIGIFKRTNDLNITDFKLVINTANPAGTKVSVTDLNGVHQFYMDDPVGTKISGKTGTLLEGVEFVYTGGATNTITVNLSHGIGDRMFNILDEVLKDSGTLDKSVNFLNGEEDRMKAEIKTIDDQIENFRETLLLRFTALEEAIAKINTLLEYIKAQNEFTFAS